MSVVCYELQDSMSGSIKNEDEKGEVRELVKRYLIGQCLGFNDAAVQIERFAPDYISADGAGIYWIRRNLALKCIGNRYWDVTATYQTYQPKNGGSGDGEGGGGGSGALPGSLAWDTTGNTEHITSGVGAEEVEPADEDNFEGAINVSGGSVQGLDVVRPSLRYSETWQFPASVATSGGYVRGVASLTGSVNLNAFRAFAPGEALFMGAKAQWRGDEPFVAVTFDFECRSNGDFYVTGMPPMYKEGWDYVWVRYRDDVNGGSLIRRPRSLHKVPVYKPEDWSGLLIVDQAIGVQRTGRRGQPSVAQQVRDFLG